MVFIGYIKLLPPLQALKSLLLSHVSVEREVNF